MPVCDVCGNDYDKAFRVRTAASAEYTFDSIECAAQLLAPTCEHCRCRILGHGLEAQGRMYCCVHCATKSGEEGLRDRVTATAH
ncbi:MAG: hypothetical protein U5R31_05960 [Acidimicrobiia bacterium]|nr:hypothetical protein [Acidimicrobiia bacterium]